MTTSGVARMPEMKTHQIVMRSHSGKLRVSCQCRASELKHERKKGGGEYYEPFSTEGYPTVWDAYNDPVNHEVEFTDADKVRTHI